MFQKEGFRRFSKILDVLKDSGKYRIMTAKQYLETLRKEPVSTNTQSSLPIILPDWTLYLMVGVVAVVPIVLLIRRYALSKRLKKNFFLC